MAPLPLTGFLYDQRSADREPVTVFDIGCSGGIGPEWNAFGHALRGIGFDPLVPEIERLRSVETRPHLAYEACFVGLKPAQRAQRADYENALPERMRDLSQVFSRTSSKRALRLTGTDHAREFYNGGQALEHSDRHIAIDDYVRAIGSVPDVLKIDTDGADMEVLLGAEDTIGASVLAVHVECRLQNALSRHTNNLPAIDTFLRERGLLMYVIEPFRYTRAALPGPFEYEMFASTRGGPSRWANLTYIRDLAVPDHERVFGFAATPERVIKTAALMEVFGLPDCAAELLQAHAAALPYPAETLLDLLVPGHLGEGLSYRDYMARFEADPGALLPSRLRVPRVVPPPSACPMQRIDLGRARSEPEWKADLRRDANGITVRSGAAPWAYAAFIPLPPGEQPSSVELEVHGVTGRIGFALALDHAAQRLSGHVLLDAGCGAVVVVVLPVPTGMTVAGVMVRNASEDGSRSGVTIASARVLRPRPATAAPLPADRSASGC